MHAILRAGQVSVKHIFDDALHCEYEDYRIDRSDRIAAPALEGSVACQTTYDFDSNPRHPQPIAILSAADGTPDSISDLDRSLLSPISYENKCISWSRREQEAVWTAPTTTNIFRLLCRDERRRRRCT